jgi:hypothetical protein
MTKTIGRPGANAVPFWVRIMLARGDGSSGGKPTMKAGTLGSRIFGGRSETEPHHAIRQSAAVDASPIRFVRCQMKRQ